MIIIRTIFYKSGHFQPKAIFQVSPWYVDEISKIHDIPGQSDMISIRTMRLPVDNIKICLKNQNFKCSQKLLQQQGKNI